MMIHLIPLPPSPRREVCNMLIINEKTPPSWGRGWGEAKESKRRI
jgi:hypothetical protein